MLLAREEERHITPASWTLEHSSTGSTIGVYEKDRAKVPLIETLVPQVFSRETLIRVAPTSDKPIFTINDSPPPAYLVAAGAKNADIRARPTAFPN